MNLFPQCYREHYPGQSDERLAAYYSQDLSTLKGIVSHARRAPIFRKNKRFSELHTQDTVYQIPFSSILEGELLICAHSRGEGPSNFWDSEAPSVVKRYDTIEDLLADGWMLD
jgi:hypothetical protein